MEIGLIPTNRATGMMFILLYVFLSLGVEGKVDATVTMSVDDGKRSSFATPPLNLTRTFEEDDDDDADIDARKSDDEDDDEKWKWAKLKKEASVLQSAIDKKDSSGTEDAIERLVRTIPKQSALYYVGLETGKDTKMAIGRADYWHGDAYTLRIDQWYQNPEVLTMSKEVKGLALIYTGRNQTLETSPLSDWTFRGTKEGYNPVYGLEKKTRISSNIVGHMDARFWKENGKLVEDHRKSKTIAVPASSWDLLELAKDRTTLVIADYSKKHNHLTVRYTAKLRKSGNTVYVDRTEEALGRCVRCSTEEMKDFLWKASHQ